MPLSLHAMLVPSYLRILQSSYGWLDKAEAFIAEKGISESDLIDARLIDDMLPFAYQMKSMSVHSRKAVEGVRQGWFSPDNSEPPASIAAMRAMADETIAFLEELTEAEFEGMIGQPMQFRVGPKVLDFKAENFLLGFSLPNFYFHSVTAYDVLRKEGVPVGKLDYLARLPIEIPAG